MRRSAWMIWTLLLAGLWVTTSYVCGATRPMRGVEQQNTAEPQQNADKDTATRKPRPNPDPSGIYHVGDGVSAPQIAYSVDPEFTDKAREKKISGACTIGLVVDSSGNPRDVHIVKSIAESVPPKLRSDAPGLDQKAVEAVKQYKFKPGEFQGKAVPVETTVEINFRIY